jgi:hypothetical protein
MQVMVKIICIHLLELEEKHIASYRYKQKGEYTIFYN